MLYVLLSYGTQTTDLRRPETSGGGFTPPAFAREKSMEPLLLVAPAPRRFPAFGSRTSPSSNRYKKSFVPNPSFFAPPPFLLRDPARQFLDECAESCYKHLFQNLSAYD